MDYSAQQREQYTFALARLSGLQTSIPNEEYRQLLSTIEKYVNVVDINLMAARQIANNLVNTRQAEHEQYINSIAQINIAANQVTAAYSEAKQMAERADNATDHVDNLIESNSRLVAEIKELNAINDKLANDLKFANIDATTQFNYYRGASRRVNALSNANAKLSEELAAVKLSRNNREKSLARENLELKARIKKSDSIILKTNQRLSELRLLNEELNSRLEQI
jgi:uncharacterized phage infection (PIP) family protein YhgE